MVGLLDYLNRTKSMDSGGFSLPWLKDNNILVKGSTLLAMVLWPLYSRVFISL